MAQMIPEVLAPSSRATSGERRVFELLRKALLPDEEFLVWYEPKNASKRPDFLVWSQSLGLLALELKSWTDRQLLHVDPDNWRVLYRDVETSCKSPVEQAWQCLLRYKDKIQQSPVLSHVTGPNQGAPRFPLGRCVLFTEIPRSHPKAQRILEAVPPHSCLFRDDLDFDPGSPEARHTFVHKLRQAFLVRFHFDPLTPPELTVLRALIFPEVRIASPARGLRSPQQAAFIQALDLQQERTAKAIPDGHRILKGVAGSGKTLMLACRARYLKQLHPEWRILVVCFPVALAQSIRHLLSGSVRTADLPGIDVFHYHALVKTLTGANLALRKDETSADWEVRVGALLEAGLADGTVTARYDAILIDEGQDFTVDWIRSLTGLLTPNDSLLLATDPAQNIFGRRTPFIRAGIKVKGKRPISLIRSYRNTTEILQLARGFSKVERDPVDLEADPETEAALFPLDTDRHGAPPTVVSNLSETQQIQFVLDTIAHSIETDRCTWPEIGVLCVSPWSAKHFADAFQARFGQDRLYWISQSGQHKRSYDPASAAVRLCTIESIKGMEFPLVFLLGVDTLPRPDRDPSSERRLLYVGLTRAQDLLFVLGNTPSGFLQELLDLARPAAAPIVAAHA